MSAQHILAPSIRPEAILTDELTFAHLRSAMDDSTSAIPPCVPYELFGDRSEEAFSAFRPL